jgi:photosystem II stability/assembly factor-like uncharacterized protein
MKSFFVLITCVIVVTLPALAQRWEWLYPLPTGNDLFDVQFVNDSVGWAGGAFGTLLKTTDGGDTWQMHNLNRNDAVARILFTSESNGWILAGTADAVSYNAHHLLHTSDGGTTWEEQITSDSIDFRAISFADSLTGCIVGTREHIWHANIFHTVDGGLHWSETVIDTLGPLYDIDFVDSQNGWAAGNSGLMRTYDGGENWTIVRPLGLSLFTCISFVDQNSGWAGGVPLEFGINGRMVHTTDGGTTWSLLPGISTFDLRRLKFSNAAEGCALDYWGDPIYSTQDSGRTWFRSLELGIRWSGAFNDFEIFGDKMWAVGNGGHLCYSTDNGASWRVQIGGQYADFSGIRMADSLHFWAFNVYGTMKSSDGGYSWTRQVVDTFAHVNDIYLTSANNVWAVVGYYALHSFDGGQTWTSQFLGFGDTCDLHSVFFIDSLHGWICGENDSEHFRPYGQILGTNNGGQTWYENNFSYQPFGKVVFYDASFGWTLIINGSGIYRSHDGGNNWQVLGGGYDYFLAPADSLRCYAVVGRYTNRRGLFSSTDGGQTWAAYDTVSRYCGLDFNHEDFGIAVGSGVYAYTTDRGTTWITCPLNGDLYDVVVASNGEAWGAGHAGAIMHFIPPWLDAAKPRESNIPEQFSLSVYPNPFNPTTMLSFTLMHRSRVQLHVFDVLGREVRSQDLSWQEAGPHTIRFDGSALASGVYFASLHAGNLTTTQKILLLR